MQVFFFFARTLLPHPGFRDHRQGAKSRQRGETRLSLQGGEQKGRKGGQEQIKGQKLLHLRRHWQRNIRPWRNTEFNQQTGVLLLLRPV